MPTSSPSCRHDGLARVGGVSIRGLAGFGLALVLTLGAVAPAAAQSGWKAEDEVFYHIFVRSFRDSNGDRIGDLAGIQGQLDYLHELGVTSLLLTPVNPSPHYHNYFASSFEGVDPAFGDSLSLVRLARAVHARGMKIYLDQEIQYVTPEHPWWRESVGRPGSPYARYILYKDSTNREPEPAFFGMLELPVWDGRKVGITDVNLLEPAVRDYFASLFASMLDPNHDGKFDDGVDGFRIDHMMDDLDRKGRLTDLFARFWAPVFARVRAVNPNAKIIAEQYDWGYGEDFLTRGGADMVFAFPIRGAIVSGKAADLANAIRETVERTPAGKGQLVFIENHDTDRFASLVESLPRGLRLGAALNILLKGTPSIYYGQELGMRGKQFKAWGSDANDIPVREALEWHAKEGGAGEATWYKDTGPWWDNRYSRSDDGVSVDEEERNPASLLAWYRRLIRLRRSRPELVAGDERVLDSPSPDVVVVLRTSGGSSSLLMANFGASDQCVALPKDVLPPSLRGGQLRNLLAEAGAGVPGKCSRVAAYSAGLFVR